MQELLAAGLPCKGAQSDNTLGVGGELTIEPWLAASTLLVQLRVWGDSAVGSEVCHSLNLESKTNFQLYLTDWEEALFSNLRFWGR